MCVCLGRFGFGLSVVSKTTTRKRISLLKHMSYNTRPSVEIDQSIAFYDSGDSSKPQCGSDPVLKSTGQLKNPAVDLYYVTTSKRSETNFYFTVFDTSSIISFGIPLSFQKHFKSTLPFWWKFDPSVSSPSRTNSL